MHRRRPAAGRAAGEAIAGRATAAEASQAGELLDDLRVRQIGSAGFGDDGTALHDQHPVGESGEEVEVLFDEQDGQLLRLADVFQDGDELLDDGRLDAFCWLVEQDHDGVGDEATSEG